MCQAVLSSRRPGCTRLEVGFVPSRRSSIAGKEKWHRGQRYRRKRQKQQPRRLGAAGEPVPRLGAAPARSRRPCTSRLRNRGSPGRRKPSGLPVHTKTGVTAARLPPERTEPGNRFLAPPARGDEADARKQQRRAAANCTSCPSHGQRSGAAPTTACPREEARR